MNKIEKNIYKVFQYFVLVVFSLPFLAAIFAALRLEFLADIIYFIYSFTCHQLNWRSVYLFDYQLAWCARDTFIWGGILASTFIVKRYKVKINWVLLPAFIIPIALDGGIQTIATVLGFIDGDNFYTSTNLLRMLTGGWFGIGIGMLLSSMVHEISSTKKLKTSIKLNLRYSSIALGGLFFVYLILVQIWGFTSQYKPKNFLDLAVKIPAQESERWIRQKDGTCKSGDNKDITQGSSVTSTIFLPQDCF